MEEGTIIAARILDGYYFYRVPVNADGCTFYGASGKSFILSFELNSKEIFQNYIYRISPTTLHSRSPDDEATCRS